MFKIIFRVEHLILVGDFVKLYLLFNILYTFKFAQLQPFHSLTSKVIQLYSTFQTHINDNLLWACTNSFNNQTFFGKYLL